MSFGCHTSMFLAINVLCDRGDNLLIPNPTFPLAVTICQNLGIEYRQYNLIVSLYMGDDLLNSLRETGKWT